VILAGLQSLQCGELLPLWGVAGSEHVVDLDVVLSVGRVIIRDNLVLFGLIEYCFGLIYGILSFIII